MHARCFRMRRCSILIWRTLHWRLWFCDTVVNHVPVSILVRNLGNFRVVLPPHWVLQHLERRAPVSQLPYFHIVPLLPLHAVAASLAVKNENNDPNYDQTCYDAASDCTLGRSRTVVVGTGISSTGGSLQFAQVGQGAVVPTLYCRW